jgi:hypothetical protein
MISNERRSPYISRPYGASNYNQPRPQVIEDTLRSGELQIERKLFFLNLKENPRGRFLRISEEVGGRRNCIIIPATGLKDFQKLLADMVKAESEIPPKMDAPPV